MGCVFLFLHEPQGISFSLAPSDDGEKNKVFRQEQALALLPPFRQGRGTALAVEGYNYHNNNIPQSPIGDSPL